MITDLSLIIGLPMLAGIILFLIPDAWRMIKGGITLLVSLVVLFFAIRIFGYEEGLVALMERSGESVFVLRFTSILENYLLLNINSLSQVILLFVAVIAALISMYSIYKEENSAFPSHFYSWFLITLGAGIGTVMVDNLLLFLFYWGVMGLTLFKLIASRDELSSAAAKKTLIIIGSSDALMILGIGLLWGFSGTLSISEMSASPVTTGNGTTVIAFLLLAIGAFTKAGAFPFHTWITDFTANAHGISSAFMPASMDKLVGIYFLTVLCTRIFELNEWLVLILLIIGVCTIIFAVMMALIQHNFKKLLGYHAVSQVGYMVVGIALGSPLGIAAGLFHMFNNAIYKGGLFLTATSIERRTGTSDIDEAGGLASAMPITFIAALVFALSISGVPPLNGFASKWMIYQGIVEFGQGSGIANQLWIVWLGLAVFGSALTLASFVKFIAGIFLGRRKEIYEKTREVSVMQWIPVLLMAVVCIWFGAFSTKYIATKLLMPVAGEFTFIGIWDSTLLLSLVLVSLITGFLIYWLGSLKNMRRVEPYIGGEKANEEKEFPVTGFYLTLQKFRFLSFFYTRAERKWFDIYELIKGLVMWGHRGFRKLHTGVLTTYSFWLYGGFLIILLLLIILK